MTDRYFLGTSAPFQSPHRHAKETGELIELTAGEANRKSTRRVVREPFPARRRIQPKLLDPDPIVRRMAEQDILVMGRAARDYLMDQRANAPPLLQDAIDRIWRRILQDQRP